MTLANRLRVLVFDMEQLVADIVVEMASVRGHHAVSTPITLGRDKALQTTACDVVIFALKLLPFNGGNDYLSSLRRRYPAVKIVGTSSTQRRPFPILKLDAILCKPFSLNQLDDVLSDITSSSAPQSSHTLQPMFAELDRNKTPRTA
jgi:DNA-binding response OmpR family regulator